MKVRINAGGREVEAQWEPYGTNFNLKAALDEVLALWRQTEAPKPAEEKTQRAFGLQAAPDDKPREPMSMGGYGGSYIVDPKAAARCDGCVGSMPYIHTVGCPNQKERVELDATPSPHEDDVMGPDRDGGA